MTVTGGDLWTLDQLAEQVESALATGYGGATNGRVRSVPDRRAIRWYATIGLVDRPVTTRGRTALYGERHLLQLVSIKRRQATGRSLAEIQAELTGATDAALREIAQLPANTPLPAPPPPSTPRMPRFWSTTPAPPTPPAPPTTSATPPPPRTMPASATTPAPPTTPAPLPTATRAAGGAPSLASGTRPVYVYPDGSLDTAAPADPPGVRPDHAAAESIRSGAVGVVPALSLGGGVTVVLPAGSAVPDAAGLRAIRAAAEPLLRELGRLAVRAQPTGVIEPDQLEGSS